MIDDAPEIRAAKGGNMLVRCADRLMEWSSLRRGPIRRYGLAAALLAFAVGLYLAIAANPSLVADLRFAPLIVLVAISAPLGTVLNAAELWAQSRIAGGPMSWRTAGEITIYTSAANMLPLPGGALTKLAGFKAHGIGYAAGSTMVLLSFLVWGGLAFAYSAGALWLLGRGDLAVLFALGGVLLLGAGAAGYRRFGNWPMIAFAAATRLLNFVIEGWRYWLALSAMGMSVSYLECSVFVVVTFIGAAVVIVPSGLGISEAAGALVATLIGISAAAGFVSTAIQRIARLVGLAVMAALLLALSGRRPAIPDRADTPPAP